ncbi:MAG: aldolase catalytic domain-containing protein, partial [Ilumatobacteraceae bacterium]
MTTASEDIPTHITLLDCTLRDGGYYNDWDFSKDLIRRYLSAVSRAGIGVVEVGFRSAQRGKYLGPTAYTTDRFLESLGDTTSSTYGVMMNASELVASPAPADLVDELFAPRSDSPVDLVRIAAHYREVEGLAPAIERLKELGYDIGLNLMQIAARSHDEIQHFAGLVGQFGVDIAYFADSFGGMQPADVTQVVASLQGAFDGPIGAHMHDNMSLGFANSMAAVEAGATYVDATLLGMGRGPGNARTEYMTLELARRGMADLDVVPLLPLVMGDFAELQREYGWGSNAYYFLAAAHNIHPTYIQEMSTDGRYAVDEIVTALTQLGAAGASFDRGRLQAATNDTGDATDAGDSDISGWCEGRDVLIVGPGPAGTDRREDIEDYIRHAHPVVIALNAIAPVDAGLVDAYAICHPVRVMIDADEIAALKQPVFMPAGVRARLGDLPDHCAIRNYAMTVRPDEFSVGPTSSVVPRISAFPYALAIAVAGGATSISLTGFDGFDA